MPVLSSVGNLTSSYEQLLALRNLVLIRGPKEILFQLERWSYLGWYRLYNVSASVIRVLQKSFCLSLSPVVQFNTWPLHYSSMKPHLHHIPHLAQNLWVSDAYPNLSTVWTIHLPNLLSHPIVQWTLSSSSAFLFLASCIHYGCLCPHTSVHVISLLGRHFPPHHVRFLYGPV